MNTLKSIGLNDHISNYLSNHQITEEEVGRIIRHDKTQYIVKTIQTQAPAELTGNLLHSDSDLPVIGDWVKVIDFDGHFIITGAIPGYSHLRRKAINHDGHTQSIAANIDQAFIVQSVDNDFNLNRLERYIAMAYDGEISPIVVLNKSDLKSEDELKLLKESVKNRVNKTIPVLCISASADEDLNQLETLLNEGTTSCFLGSSGVGKSTIVNRLLNKDEQQTSKISDATNKGRHTTTSRQMFATTKGGLIIDTPGMRELGVAVSEQGLETSFASIYALAEQCRFSDCTHQNEPGCAVQEAVANNQIEIDQLDNYHKLRNESRRFQKSKAELNKEGKRFSKVYKAAMAHRNRRKP